MGKQAGPAGVIALRRDEKLFMTIPPAEGTDFIHDPDLLQRLWPAGALFQPLYPFRGLDFTKWRKMAFPISRGSGGNGFRGPWPNPGFPRLTAIPALIAARSLCRHVGYACRTVKPSSASISRSCSMWADPTKTRRAAFFEERAHTLAETLVPAVDDLFRARGEFGARAEHPLKIPVEVRMDVAPGVAFP